MNSMKTEKQKGFTLIEVLIVVVMTMILLLSVGTFLFAGHTFWRKAWKMVEFQRDASYAMLRLSHPIKEGTEATVQSDGTSVTIFSREGDWIRFFLVPGTTELQYEIPGQNLQTINDNVEDLQFSVVDNIVTIDLSLEKDNLLLHLASAVMMRNYGL